jgi:hypothetical protein
MSKLIFTLICLSAFGGAIPCQAKTIYVDADANGLNNGSSWVNAYKFLQDALSDANSSPKMVEIRVAQGVYKPDQGVGITPGDREATFQLFNGVTLKGGYAGTGQPDPNVRDTILYESILSADLEGDDIDNIHNWSTKQDNSYHVLYSHEVITTAVLDGFIITGASWGLMYNWESSPILANCTFSDNWPDSGGMLNTVNSNPILINCIFRNNRSDGPGAGMSNYHNSPTLIGCTFSGNYSGDDDGGGMYNYNSNPTLVNCSFNGNSGYYYGGAMVNIDSVPTLTNCTFIGNLARNGGGGGMYNLHSSLTLTNCIFVVNSADWGAGMFNNDCNRLTMTNCTFFSNSASDGNALACSYYYYETKRPSQVEIINSIFRDGGNEIWNDDGSIITIRYTDLQGGQMGIYDPCGGVVWGAGNIDADPCFVSFGYWTTSEDDGDVWVSGDYHLKSQAGRWDANEGHWTIDDVTSPCIDAGDPSSPIGLEPFPNGGIINMGAYGGTEQASKSYFGQPPCETIVAGDINGDCIVNFKDFALMAFHWLEEH